MAYIDRLREAKERMNKATALLNDLMAIQAVNGQPGETAKVSGKEALRLMDTIADESEAIAKILREFVESQDGLKQEQSGEYV